VDRKGIIPFAASVLLALGILIIMGLAVLIILAMYPKLLWVIIFLIVCLLLVAPFLMPMVEKVTGVPAPRGFRKTPSLTAVLPVVAILGIIAGVLTFAAVTHIGGEEHQILYPKVASIKLAQVVDNQIVPLPTPEWEENRLGLSRWKIGVLIFPKPVTLRNGNSIILTCINQEGEPVIGGTILVTLDNSGNIPLGSITFPTINPAYGWKFNITIRKEATTDKLYLWYREGCMLLSREVMVLI
jgi:hypothetical protein